MFFKQIILLLNNNRDRDELPITLSKTQIISLVRASAPPNQPNDNVTTHEDSCLCS